MTVALMTSLVALFSSALTGFITYKQNKRQDSARMKELSVINLEEFKKYKYNKISEERERLFCVLQYIQSGHSLTDNYRLEQRDATLVEYDEHYDKMHELTLEAERLMFLYFPEMDQGEIKLSALENLLWGQQQRLFGYDNDDKQRQELQNQITRLSQEISKLCGEFMIELSLVSLEETKYKMRF